MDIFHTNLIISITSPYTSDTVITTDESNIEERDEDIKKHA